MKRAGPCLRQQLKLFVNHETEPLALDPEPETICYRGQTLAMVRHYFEMSSQLGRLPSILGREFFRAKVSHTSIPSFEDQALFVHDVERALQRLSEEQSEIVTMVGLYDLSCDEAAAVLRCSKGWVSQLFSEALATLTTILLESGLLKRNQPDRRQVQMNNHALGPQSHGRPPKKPCHSAAQRASGAQRRVVGASVSREADPHR